MTFPARETVPLKNSRPPREVSQGIAASGPHPLSQGWCQESNAGATLSLLPARQERECCNAAHMIDAPNDRSAMEQVRTTCDGYILCRVVEVWDGDRCVGRFTTR
jgi:hypothetical protein